MWRGVAWRGVEWEEFRQCVIKDKQEVAWGKSTASMAEQTSTFH